MVGNDALTFTSSIDNNYILTIASSTVIDSFSLVYISVGVLPEQVCRNCGKSAVLNGASCVDSCPAGTLPFNYKAGTVGCKTCSAKLGLILSGNQCIPGTTTTTTITTTRIVVPKEDKPAVAPVISTASQATTILLQIKIPRPYPLKLPKLLLLLQHKQLNQIKSLNQAVLLLLLQLFNQLFLLPKLIRLLLKAQPHQLALKQLRTLLFQPALNTLISIKSSVFAK